MTKKFRNSILATMAMATIFNSSFAYAANNSEEKQQTNQAVVNVNSLNIRSGPSTLEEILGKFELNDKVDLVSVKNGWYKIKLEDGEIAWTNGKYINLDGKVSVDKLNVRRGPSVEEDIIDFKGKETVKIVGVEENGWYEIELDNERTGYVCGKYVDTEAENLHDYSDLYNKGAKKSSKADSENVKEVSSQNSSNITMTVSATAYAGDGITSTGKVPKVGRTIAVDPKVIPYGTKVYIPSLNETYIAEDCGGAIKGNKIDIFMSSEQECRLWGVRNIEIQILK